MLVSNSVLLVHVFVIATSVAKQVVEFGMLVSGIWWEDTFQKEVFSVVKVAAQHAAIALSLHRRMVMLGLQNCALHAAVMIMACGCVHHILMFESIHAVVRPAWLHSFGCQRLSSGCPWRGWIRLVHAV